LTAGKAELYSAEHLAEFSVLQSAKGCGDAVSSAGQPAIYLVLALMTILAGIIAWLRENRAT
jgi:hypothetical protein